MSNEFHTHSHQSSRLVQLVEIRVPPKVISKKSWSTMEMEKKHSLKLPETIVCVVCRNHVKWQSVMTHSCFKTDRAAVNFINGTDDPSEDDVPTTSINGADDPAEENILMTLDSVVTHCNDDISVQERLIIAIESKPLIWDYTIPLIQKSRATINDQWRQVLSEVKDPTQSVDVLKRMWKNLKYNYARILSRESVRKSGSAGGTPEPRWHMYHQMSFLKDQLINTRSTTSSLPCDLDSDVTQVTKKKKPSSLKGGTEKDAVLDKILSILEEPMPSQSPAQVHPTATRVLPSEELDSMAHFFALIRSSLLKMDDPCRETVMLQMMTALFKCQRQLDAY